MRIIFAIYHSFDSQSAIHVFHLANELCRRGFECFVCVPSNTASVSHIGCPAFVPLTFDEALSPGSPLMQSHSQKTLIHAWTPRENVRIFTLRLAKLLRCPYVVHLEDNEETIAARQLGLSNAELLALSPEHLQHMIGPGLSHPIHSREFLEDAAGMTALIDRLLEFKPENIPGVVFWPACEDACFGPAPGKQPVSCLRRALELEDDVRLVVYPGNVHKVNFDEIFSLYLGIALVNRRGFPTRLVRIGTDFVSIAGDHFGELMDNVIELGYRPATEIPAYLAQADALVQPGGPDEYNDYRFPSKLTVFFAAGKPMLLPETNIGRYVTHEKEALVMKRGDALEIADHLVDIFQHPEKAASLGTNAREFAEKNFRWSRAASTVADFYAGILPGRFAARAGTSPSLEFCDDAFIKNTMARYAHADKIPASLSYATVEDYCDSWDHLNAFARHGDLKNVQRPWALKSILAAVPPGGRILEIGAGQPLVAAALARMGYDVTIVDPYDGTGNGPTQFEQYRAEFPEVRIIREFFQPEMPALADEKGTYDAIYSISVLEHVPLENLKSVFAAMGYYLKPDGYSLHAVDYIQKGNGDKWCRDMLLELCRLSDIAEDEMFGLLKKMGEDTETYYLSAEGHNSWRGGTPYGKFPMRVCVSLQLCTKMNKIMHHYIGGIESISREHIKGYCYDLGAPSDPVRLHLLCDSIEIGQIQANLESNNLLRLGIGNGKCGFHYRFKTELTPIDLSKIKIIPENGTESLDFIHSITNKEERKRLVYSPIDPDILKLASQCKNLLIVNHIPKTAGTSLRFAFENLFPIKQRLYHYFNIDVCSSEIWNWKFAKEPTMSFEDVVKFIIKDEIELIIGHFGPPEMNGFAEFFKIFSTAFSIAFIRNPRDAMCSLYSHARNYFGFTKSFAAYIEQPFIRNFQSKAFCGVPIDEMSFVGIADHYEKSMEALSGILGADLSVIKKNVNPKKAQAAYDYSQFADESVWKRFDELYQNDIDLYIKAKNRLFS
ncbi:MAG: methyltransferase domain-containing protein [Desulfobacteraceae bacterium]|jgi:glycosyltransferase involved in cell wall biosynthesis|nr:methyltransferase domain-containing protein [Desulfobacteraceae bacterium]